MIGDCVIDVVESWEREAQGIDAMMGGELMGRGEVKYVDIDWLLGSRLEIGIVNV